MQQIKAIVKGPYEPQDNQVLWIDTSNPDEIVEKVFEGGEWKMTQPTQQGRLEIKIRDLTELSTEEKTKIIELHNRGLLLDTIINVGDGDALYRIISDEIELNDSISIVMSNEVFGVVVY